MRQGRWIEKEGVLGAGCDGFGSRPKVRVGSRERRSSYGAR